MSELAFNRVILEKNNQTLAVVSVVSLVINLIMVVILFFTIHKKPLVVFEDSGQVTTLSKQDFILNEEILEGFARMIIKEYLSFSAVSLPKQIEGIQQYLTENPKKSILDSYKKNEKKLQKGNVLHQFSIHEMNITKKNSPFLVEVMGVRTIYANGKSKNTATTYLLEVQKIKPTKINPYGLIISKIVEQSQKKMERSK